MTRTERSSRLERSEDSLPPPPIGLALGLAGGAAGVGAATWAGLAIFANVEHGALAWAIGGLIGFAIVKAGGHGQMLAVSGAVLAVLSIGTGRHLTYQHAVAEIVDETVLESTPELHAEIVQDAKDWVALGANPTEEQINTFILDHNYEAGSIEEFRTNGLPMIEWFRDTNPTVDEWRERQREVISEFYAENFTFVDYLKSNFHPFDILFVLLGLGTAFGLVSKRTAQLKTDARQQLRAEREAEEAAAEGDAADGDERQKLAD